jgi:hypothetical protein
VLNPSRLIRLCKPTLPGPPHPALMCGVYSGAWSRSSSSQPRTIARCSRVSSANTATRGAHGLPRRLLFRLTPEGGNDFGVRWYRVGIAGICGRFSRPLPACRQYLSIRDSGLGGWRGRPGARDSPLCRESRTAAMPAERSPGRLWNAVVSRSPGQDCGEAPAHDRPAESEASIHASCGQAPSLHAEGAAAQLA